VNEHAPFGGYGCARVLPLILRPSGPHGPASRSKTNSSSCPDGPSGSELLRAHLTGHRREHPVHEAARVVVEYVLASSTASSITTATGGRSPQQLGHRQAQHEPVDDRHPFERPAYRRRLDQLVGAVAWRSATWTSSVANASGATGSDASTSLGSRPSSRPRRGARAPARAPGGGWAVLGGHRPKPGSDSRRCGCRP